MSTFLQDLRYAVRLMRQAPGFTLAAVLALALGIGATTALFSVVYAVLLRPLPLPETDRLVVVGANQAASFSERYSLYEFDEISRRSTLFKAMTAYSGSAFNLTGEGDAEQVRGFVVSGAFFETFGIAPCWDATSRRRTGPCPRSCSAIRSGSSWGRGRTWSGAP